MTRQHPIISRTGVFSSWLFLALIPSFSVVLAGKCIAQDDNVTYRISQPDRSVFVPVPRETLLPLIRATRALDENRVSDAVALLGQLLSEPMDEAYLVPVEGIKGAEGVNVSLRLRAQEMLGKLSTRDRESYRLRYGTRATLLLDQAVDERDFEKVSQVMQRYFFTEAGFAAAMLLGHHYLDQGRVVAAANCFRRVTECDEARQIHDPAASVLLATCRLLTDSTEQAETVLTELQERSLNGRIEFEGKEIPFFSEKAQALPWLTKLIGNSSLREINQVSQWLMFGGNPQRNARGGSGIPLMNSLWEVPTVNDPDLMRAIIARQKELINLGGSPIPSVQPLAMGETIVMRSFDRMIGVNATTGKRVWVFPPWNISRNNETEFRSFLQNVSIDEGNLTERMWLDSLYGHASSDGRTIFVVPNPGFAGEHSLELNHAGLTVPIIKREFNELKAIEVDREGAFKWEIGGRTGLDEPKLAKSFFLGAPLPLEGSLYVVCQQDDQIKLVVLDSDTGKLQWAQQLVSVESSVNVSKDRFRRLAGATPSFADGILVCPTGAGALIGIDLSTKALVWGYQFTTPGSRDVSQISPRQSSSQIVLEGLWRESTIMIAEGSVLHTPVDSQNLVCVDLQSGFPKWKDEEKLVGQVPRVESLFLACVESGNAILVGPKSIRAIRLADGLAAWERNIEPFGRPSGRGYANNGFYYLPTTGERLLQIELQSGTISKSVSTNGVLGNLICYGGNVISHGADRLTSFAQDEPNRRRLEAATGTGISPQLLAIKSQLQYQDGDLRGAATSMAAAFDQTGNPSFSNGLTNLIIQLVESDYDFGIELASRYDEKLFEDRKFEFEAAKIAGRVAKQDYSLAFTELIGLIEPAREFLRNQDQLIEVVAEKYDREYQSTSSPFNKSPSATSSVIKLRLDRWIRSQLIHVMDHAEEELRRQFIDQADFFVTNLNPREPGEKFEIFQFFPDVLISGTQRLSLARDLLADNELLRARYLLGIVRNGDDENLAAEATITLARMYASLNMLARAKALTHELEQRFGNATFFDGQTGNQVAQQLKSELKIDDTAFVDTEPTFLAGSASVADTEKSLASNLSPNAVEVMSLDFVDLQEYRFQFYSQTGEIEIIDGFGDTVYRFMARQKIEQAKRPVNNFVLGEARIHGDLLLISVATELFAIDWLNLKRGQNPVIWNIDIENGNKDQTSTAAAKLWGENRMTSRRSNRGRKKIFYGAPSGRGVCYFDGTNLICLDPFTGERCWQKTNFLPRSVLFGDAKFVTAWKGREARILDIATGRQAKQLNLPPELGAIWTNQGNRLLLTQKIKLPGKPNSDAEVPSAESDKDGSFDENPEQYRQFLGYYDLHMEEFIWEKKYPLSTKAFLVQNRKIAVLTPSGNLEFLEIASGDLLFRSATALTHAERDQVEEIGVAAISGSYLIYLRKNTTSDRVDLNRRKVRIRNLHYYDSFWNGFLLAVDSETGKNKWRRPIRFNNFQIGKGLPFNLPIRMFVRRYDRDENKYESYMQLVFVDVESGKTLTNVSIPFEYRNQYQVRWLPDDQRIQIDFATRQMNVDLTRPADLPPRPMASLTNESTIPLQPAPERQPKIDPELVKSEMQQIERAARLAESKLPEARAAETRQLLDEERNP